MKVDIDNLRQHVNEFIASYRIVGTNSPDAVMFSAIYDALNELELHRTTRRNFDTQLEANNAQLRADLTRITKIKDSLIVRLREQVAFYQEERSNCDCDPLNEPQEKTPFETWFKNLHPETIESITFNLRKKEN